jgi:hypothetical protein
VRGRLVGKKGGGYFPLEVCLFIPNSILSELPEYCLTQQNTMIACNDHKS